MVNEMEKLLIIGGSDVGILVVLKVKEFKFELKV